MQKAAPTVLWLFTIFLGITVGAGLYEARIVVPLWQSTPPAEWIETGRSFWAFVSTGPLTLAIILSLILVWRYSNPGRRWWIAALAIVVVERAATFAYFIPTMAWLQQHQGTSPETAAALDTWVFANHGRHLLSISAWLLALRALSLLGAGSKRKAETTVT